MAAELDQESVSQLQSRLGHVFRDRRLLRLALTHRSRAHERGHADHYERLEFLGDAVLGLITAEWLYRSRPGAPEGEMARLKSFLVSMPALADHARELGLGELLLLSAGEERTGGREKESLLADAFEGVLGALYLDGGLEVARVAIEPLIESAHERQGELAEQDVKTRLQEYLQTQGRELPEYRVLASEGPDHDRTFLVECRIEGEALGSGEGRTKKEAERRSAIEALQQLTS